MMTYVAWVGKNIASLRNFFLSQKCYQYYLACHIPVDKCWYECCTHNTGQFYFCFFLNPVLQRDNQTISYDTTITLEYLVMLLL